MNFPRWVRSEITFPAPPGVGVDEIRSRVVRALERRGATNIEVNAGRIRFRAERATSNINPLAPCRSGSFEVERDSQNVWIRYELDLFYLLVWTAVLAVGMGVIGLALLIAGSYLALVLIIAFIAITTPLNYAFCCWRTKALFRIAATQ